MIKKYLSVSAQTVFISLLALIFSYILLQLQLRYLGMERGTLILAQAHVAVLISLVRVGTNQSILLVMPECEPEVVSANFIFMTILQGVATALIVLVLFNYTNLLGDHLQSLSIPVVIMFSVSTLFFSTISNFSFLMHNSKMYVLQTVLTGVLNIVFLLLPGLFVTINITTVLLSQTAAQICVVVCLLFLLPKFRVKNVRYSILKKLITVGAKSMGWAFLKDLAYKIDLLMFGHILSKDDFNIYCILQNLCQSIWRVTDQIIAAYSKYLLQIEKSEYVRFTNKVLWILAAAIAGSMLLGWVLIIPCFEFIAGIPLDNYLGAALLLLFAMLIFNTWKLLSNLFLRMDHHLSMYISLLLQVLLFFIAGRLATGLNSSALITAIVYTIASLGMLPLYVMIARSKKYAQYRHVSVSA